MSSLKAGEIPFESSLKEANVVLQSLQDGQGEGLMLGNGDLYGVVWERDGVLTMRVTKNDIWDARVDTSEDGELPRVDIAGGKVSGPVHAPPSYRLPYPHPICAAALRLGGTDGGTGVWWRCIRKAPQHGFAPAEDATHALMHVGGGQRVSTGYSATLTKPVEASFLRMRLKGTPNASYYVNVYDASGKPVLGSGWKQSPVEMTDIELPFPASAVGRVELYAMTADGKRAENQVASLSLSGTGGDVPISLSMPASEATGALDLRRGVATVRHPQRPDTIIRVLSDRNVVLIRGPGEVALEPISLPSLPAPKIGEIDGIEWLHMVLPGDVDYAGMAYAVAVARDGDLKAVSLVTSFDDGNGDVLQRAIALARDTIQQKEAALVAAHERAWESFWSRSGMQLADKDLQNLWYRMLYFARTVCKPGAAPVALMPPLATDVTPWHSDIHYNYNAWQAFWPLPTANQAELVDPWASYLLEMIPRFKWLARETFNVEGVYVPISSFLHEPDPAKCKSKNARQMSMNPWGLTIGMVGMTAQSIWQKHLCDPDQAYMEKKIYPFLKEAARFYVSFMEKCKKDESGKILLGPSYSPEHGAWGIYDCPYDIAYVHYTFDAFIQAAGELGGDPALAEQCRTYKELLGPYPTAPDKEGKLVVVDWRGCPAGRIAQHNIEVPSTPVFPGDQVTWFSPEAEKELFRNTIRHTKKTGGNSHVMLNIAKARLSMLEAVPDAKSFIMPSLTPSGFIKMPWAHGTYMQEMIGFAGLVNEFLLQSVDNKIRLFPCWPADKDAAFTRLRAQGGFLVSAEQKDGDVVNVEIESTAGGTLRVLSPWKTIKANGEEITPDEKGIASIETKKGDKIGLAPAIE